MTTDERIAASMASIRDALAGYVFRVRSEAELQGEVYGVLCLAFHNGKLGDVELETEVKMIGGGRCDIVARWSNGPVVVLELKLKASAAAVERQAQRYARMEAVDAVLVVTTCQRLALELADYPYPTLGGKPFGAVALRTS